MKSSRNLRQGWRDYFVQCGLATVLLANRVAIPGRPVKVCDRCGDRLPRPAFFWLCLTALPPNQKRVIGGHTVAVLIGSAFAVLLQIELITGIVE